MVALDYGVIVIMDGKVMNGTSWGEEHGLDDRAQANKFVYKGLSFYHSTITATPVSGLLNKEPTQRLPLSYDNSYHKVVWYATMNYLSLKVKTIAVGVWRTTFKDDGHHFTVIQGSDISLVSWWHPTETKKLISHEFKKASVGKHAK